MSHSLHRYGTYESLKNDYCIYARCAKGVNRDHPGDKLRKILSIYLSEEYVNFGSSHAGKNILNGLEPEEYAKTLDNSYGIISTFAKRSAVAGVLKKIRDAELGVSIVVSGLIDQVVDIARECNLKPHTATLSLGIYGDRSLLAKGETLMITTMCGHSQVGTNLVESVREKVKNKQLTPEEAARILSKPCPCGIFNTVRCAELIGK